MVVMGEGEGYLEIADSMFFRFGGRDGEDGVLGFGWWEEWMMVMELGGEKESGCLLLARLGRVGGVTVGVG